MSKSCRVPFCDMKRSMRKRCPGLSFHEFPADLTLREKWLKVIRRKDFIPQDTDHVCSIHFHPNDFKTGLKVVRLKPSAVPSIFPNYPKYLQKKIKPERREIKRASPETIASFKRSRKEKQKNNCQQDTNDVPTLTCDTISKQEMFDSVEEVAYEVIPIDDSLQRYIGNNLSETKSPETRDASTQASGMWEKIQELYKVIRKLRIELQKKEKVISNLTKQNRKLQSQLLDFQPKKVVESEKGKKLQAKPKKKTVKENINVKPDDLSSYLHPRVPRSLLPPKNRNLNNVSQNVLSVSQPNKIISQDAEVSAIQNMDLHNKDSILISALNSAPNIVNKTIDCHHHGTKLPVSVITKPNPPEVMNKLDCMTNLTNTPAVTEKQKTGHSQDTSMQVTDRPTCAVVDSVTMPVVCVQERSSFSVQDQKESKEKCAERQHTETLSCDSETSNKFVILPENCIVKNHGDEVFIYSVQDVNS